ncbi:MAG: hypothetical protein M0002_16135 [Rhodospirillales bacterium]|nr:hypothetical protein [Rhodospirillales bacterium]
MRLKRRLRPVPALLLLATLAGCVYGPAYPYPGYTYYGTYYEPPVVTGGLFIGGGWWGRGCCYGGGHWHER